MSQETTIRAEGIVTTILGSKSPALDAGSGALLLFLLLMI